MLRLENSGEGRVVSIVRVSLQVAFLDMGMDDWVLPVCLPAVVIH